jgi:hypothetical protein
VAAFVEGLGERIHGWRSDYGPSRCVARIRVIEETAAVLIVEPDEVPAIGVLSHLELLRPGDVVAPDHDMAEHFVLSSSEPVPCTGWVSMPWLGP